MFLNPQHLAALSLLLVPFQTPCWDPDDTGLQQRVLAAHPKHPPWSAKNRRKEKDFLPSITEAIPCTPPEIPHPPRLKKIQERNSCWGKKHLVPSTKALLLKCNFRLNSRDDSKQKPIFPKASPPLVLHLCSLGKVRARATSGPKQDTFIHWKYSTVVWGGVWASRALNSCHVIFLQNTVWVI